MIIFRGFSFLVRVAYFYSPPNIQSCRAEQLRVERCGFLLQTINVNIRRGIKQKLTVVLGFEEIFNIHQALMKKLKFIKIGLLSFFGG